MQINMTTFAARKTHYIDESLQTLFASEWASTGATLNLILGSEDDSHVRRYADHPLVRLVPWDAETNPSLRLNCTLNKIRALRWGDDESTLIVEDDVAFPRGWLARLERARAELTGQYVLSLFAAVDLLETANLVEGKQWIKEYPTPALQGAQALYYPSRAMRAEVAAYLAANLRQGCGDDLIGRCAKASAALYATRDPLIENIGAISCFH